MPLRRKKLGGWEENASNQNTKVNFTTFLGKQRHAGVHQMIPGVLGRLESVMVAPHTMASLGWFRAYLEKRETSMEGKSLYNNKKYMHIYFLVSAPSSWHKASKTLLNRGARRIFYSNIKSLTLAPDAELLRPL